MSDGRAVFAGRPGRVDMAGDTGGMPLMRKPVWLKAGDFRSPGYLAVQGLMDRQRLHTVCASAVCPNRGRCWEEGTAAFMILGDICTRRCAFCAVLTGRPGPVDRDEPMRLAVAVRAMGLRHVVITSVDRDDLADGGAEQFAACIRAVRGGEPGGGGTTVEVLTPDFRGKEGALQVVLAAEPTVFNHNVETVARLYPEIRPAACYDRSLSVLAWAGQERARRGGEGALLTKSGIMLGLGETDAEVREVLRDLRAVGVALLTMGQYLQPSRQHHPVARFLAPEVFAEWRREALAMGFVGVESHPLARSSFHARQLMG
ncbi:MAG: lipoyl synthase [Magnetococcus sp. DMHC-8]